MTDCGCIQTHDPKKRKVLWWVLWINLIVFGAQLTAALIAHSTALLADSFDMIGDVFAYGLSLYALSRGQTWFAKAALIKGLIILSLAILVIIDALLKMSVLQITPSSNLMIIFSLVGLLANGICLWLLTRFRDSDINMRSVWICARNDIFGNVSVLISAGLVAYFHSRWPDILVGLVLAFVLIRSAWGIIREAKIQLGQ